MSMHQPESDRATRVADILGVLLAEDVVRQWPQMAFRSRLSSVMRRCGA